MGRTAPIMGRAPALFLLQINRPHRMQPSHLSREGATDLATTAHWQPPGAASSLPLPRKSVCTNRRPILFAASLAAIAFADLDRKLLRNIFSPHGALKHQDGRKAGEVRRA